MITTGLIFMMIGFVCMVFGWFLPTMLEIAWVLMRLGFIFVVIYIAGALIDLIL